jgi:cellulose 1,4-beta-cellobiosidase
MRSFISKSFVTLLLVAAQYGAVAASRTRQIAGSCAGNVTLDASTNIWKTQKLHANTFYRRKVEAAAALIEDPELKRQAFRVGDVGSFVWLWVLNNVIWEGIAVC